MLTAARTPPAWIADLRGPAPAVFAGCWSPVAPGLLWVGAQLPVPPCSCNYSLTELVSGSCCCSVWCRAGGIWSCSHAPLFASPRRCPGDVARCGGRNGNRLCLLLRRKSCCSTVGCGGADAALAYSEVASKSWGARGLSVCCRVDCRAEVTLLWPCALTGGL